MERRQSKINLHNSSRRVNNSFDSVDRISGLPNSILGIILSLLPTKDAVATSVLSKSWKFVWRTVHNFDFCHWGYKVERFEGEDMKFVKFVNCVLLLQDARLLHTFRLLWKPRCISFHVSSWISTAIARNVHELVLCVEAHVGPESSPEPIEMPISVFSCTTLRSLELKEGIYVSDADVVCLPRLESLKLISVDFESEEAFETLISGCPMLNYLHLYIDIDYMINYHGREYDFTYTISSTSLRRLEVCFYYNIVPPVHTFYCNLELDASSLEYLKIGGCICDVIVQNGLRCLVDVDLRIDIFDDDISQLYICEQLVELIRTFDCAKTLSLSDTVVWALSFAPISLSVEFKRLEKLKTGSYCCYCSSLQEFIQISERLEVLTINKHSDMIGKEHHDHSKWTAPAEVPRCLSNSLKKVELDGYCGYEDEREMIRYILKHGSVLEFVKISIDSLRDNAKLELAQEICNFPRKSSACEIEFFGDPLVRSTYFHSVLSTAKSASITLNGQ